LRDILATNLNAIKAIGKEQDTFKTLTENIGTTVDNSLVTNITDETMKTLKSNRSFRRTNPSNLHFR